MNAEWCLASVNTIAGASFAQSGLSCLLAIQLKCKAAADTDAEVEELSNLRRLLCIPSDTYREIELATKGRIFQVRQTAPVSGVQLQAAGRLVPVAMQHDEALTGITDIVGGGGGRVGRRHRLLWLRRPQRREARA